MTWFKVDDKAPNHPKMRAAGVEGRALWNAAGPLCASLNTDGVVDALTMRDACYLAEVDQAAALTKLVASGLWHDAKSVRKCQRCKDACGGKLDADACYFHDWLDYQLTKDQAKISDERRKMNRNRALLRNRILCAQIQERDGTLCRYCAVRVNWLDRRSPVGATYDHKDPDGVNSLENVVVACNRCNATKNNRTPEEAGMVLLDPPRRDLPRIQPVPDPDLNRFRTDSEPDQNGFETDLTSRAPHTRAPDRAGSVRNGFQSDSDPDLNPVRSDGSGRAAAASDPVLDPVRSSEDQAS